MTSVYRLFLSGVAPEDMLTEFQDVSLAEIYAAMTYALANPAEIGAEIDLENRLEAEALEVRHSAVA